MQLGSTRHTELKKLRFVPGGTDLFQQDSGTANSSCANNRRQIVSGKSFQLQRRNSHLAMPVGMAQEQAQAASQSSFRRNMRGHQNSRTGDELQASESVALSEDPVTLAALDAQLTGCDNYRESF